MGRPASERRHSGGRCDRRAEDLHREVRWSDGISNTPAEPYATLQPVILVDHAEDCADPLREIHLPRLPERAVIVVAVAAGAVRVGRDARRERDRVYAELGLTAVAAGADPRPPITVEVVRQALRRLHDPVALAGTPLARGGCRKTGPTTPEPCCCGRCDRPSATAGTTSRCGS
jgi:hypothetical protein